MSTEAAAPMKFFIWAPYQTDPDMMKRRLAVRSQHVAAMQAFKDKGIITFGVPLSTPESASLPVEEKELIGSGVMMEAPSVEEVKKILENDVYWTGNVWDKEKLVIGHIFT